MVVCASQSFLLYKPTIAKWIVDSFVVSTCLGKLAGNTEFNVRNSSDFVESNKWLRLEDDKIVVPFDAI